MGKSVYYSLFHRVSSSIKACLLIVTTAVALTDMSITLAQAVDPSSEIQVTQVFYPVAAGHLLISYSLQQEILGVHDNVPLLRIYGDGRVHVHRPEYLKQSGDYQMYLSAEELQTLCLEMTQRNVMSYQKNLVDEEIVATQRQTNISYIVSDDVHSSIELNLHAVKLNSRSTAEAVGKRKHVVKNVQARAKHFSNIQLLGDMAFIEQRLNEIIYSPKLQIKP